MSPFRSRQFKALKQVWYERLKDEGFDEIEVTESKSEALKDYHAMFFKKKHLKHALFDQRLEFYLKASEFYLEYEFTSETEREIFRLFSEGLSLRQISQSMRDDGIKINKDTVNKHLRPLVEKMKRGF